MATKEEKVDDVEGDEDAAAVDPQAAAKKKKLIMLGGIGAVLLMLAGGGSWLMISLLSGDTAEQPQADADSEAAGTDEKPAPAKATAKPPAEYIALDPAFLANFTIGNRQRYLQVSIVAMARDTKHIEALRSHMPLVRNRIVMLLSGENFEQLQTDEGRVLLQQKVLAAIQELLQKETGQPGIEQVFFTNFVMQ